MENVHSSAVFVVAMTQLNKDDAQPPVYTANDTFRANSTTNKMFCSRLKDLYSKHEMLWENILTACNNNLPPPIIAIGKHKKIGVGFCNKKKSTYMFKKDKSKTGKQYWLPSNISTSRARLMSRALNYIRMLNQHKYCRIMPPAVNIECQKKNINILNMQFKKISQLLI